MISPTRMLSHDLGSKMSTNSVSPDSKASFDEEMAPHPASSSSSTVGSAPPLLAQIGRSSSSLATIKLTNTQNGSGAQLQTKKRKTSHVRACDACAIRKVKCDLNRPCNHCVSNKITCTLVRQRKKCGPKNLHKKTLDSISSVSVPDSPICAPVLTKYLLSDISSAEVVELLQMLNQPTVFSFLAPLTVPSTIKSFAKHIEFINDNSVNEGRILVDPTDPIFISKLSVIFTLILILIENLIKLLSLNHEFKFEVRNLTYYKNFKHHLQTKLSETLSTLDKLLIFPSFSLQFKQQITYYNQALTSLHLFRYYQIASLNEQQKLIYLRKAITFFQLVSIPVGNKSDLSTVQLYELYETVFELERFNLLFQFNLVLKDSNLLLREWVFSASLQVSTDYDNFMFQMLKVLNKYDLFNDKILGALSSYALVPSTSFRGENALESDDRYVPRVNFEVFKKELDMVQAKYSPSDSIIKNVILFKILVFYSKNLYFKVTDPLFEIINGINDALDPSDNMLSLSLSNQQVIPHLLQLLRFYVDIEQRSNGAPEFVNNKRSVIELSHKIVAVSPLGYCNVDNLIQSNRLLKFWYESLPQPYNRSDSEMEWRHSAANDAKEPNLYELLDELEISNLISNSQTPTTVISSSAPQAHTMALLPPRPHSTQLEQAISNGPSSHVEDTMVPSKVNIENEVDSNVTSLSPSINLVDFNPVPITAPAPPVITPANIKREEVPEMNPLVVSESTKSLYNLFNQVHDDLTTTASSNSLSNLFHFGMNRDWKPPTQEEIKNSTSDFML